MSAAGAVLLREAVRNARRWQTYGLRVAFSAALLGLVLAVWDSQLQREVDVADMGRVGRELFLLYIGLQLFLAALLAPLLVGLGIVEERDERTLELLAITRLTTREILGGKVVARLLVLLTVVIGGTPVLALVLSLGGVGVWEVVNATSNTALVVVLLGALGGFMALFSRAGVASIAAAAGYALAAFVIVPIVFALMLDRGDGPLEAASPLFAMGSDRAWGLVPWVVFLPVLVVVGRLAAPVFRMVTSAGGVEEALLSPDVWVVERFRRRVGSATLAMVASFPLVFVADHPVFPRWLHPAAAFGWLILAELAGAGLYLLAMLALGQAAERWSKGSEVSAPRPWRWGRGGGASRREPRGNPVTWRETHTRAHGPMRTVSRAATWCWIALLLSVWSCEGPDEEAHYALGVFAVFIAGIATLLGATASFAEERRLGALPLLLLSTMRPWRIVWGKLVAVANLVAPLLALAGVLVSVTLWFDAKEVWERRLSWTDDPLSLCAPGEILVGVPVAKAAFLLGWCVSVWAVAALGAMVVAARVRPARLAWVLNLVLAALALVGPVIAHDLLGRRTARPLLELWLPLTVDGATYTFCGIAPQLVVSTLLYGSLAVVLFALLSLRLRDWGTDERG